MLEVTREEWDDLVAVNLRSLFLLCQRPARRMLDRPPVPAFAGSADGP